MTALSRIVEAVRPAVDLVYPPRCPLCGDALAEQEGLCAPCWQTLELPRHPACASCQRPLDTVEQRDAATQCVVCLGSPPGHDGIAAATFYNDPARQLVLKFKHGKRIALADLMARMIAAQLPQVKANAVLVPVPLHPSRLWQRGFNQSALIAQALAKRTALPLVVDALKRTRATPMLGGLDRKARAKTLKGAIAVRSGKAHAVEGVDIILVDDVLTSGATSAACVAALKKAGAASVTIACFARVLDEARKS